MKRNVAVLYGSRSCEHDVSVISGIQAAGALNNNLYEVERVYIAGDGNWYVGDALKDMKFYQNPDFSRVTRVIPAAGEQRLLLLRADEKRGFFSRILAKDDAVYGAYDVVVPVMHGMNGEDGTLQGMLELFNVPHTSAGVMGSAVGMDKITMKLLFRGCGLPTLDGVWFDRAEWGENREALLDRTEGALSYPMFVKPANLGSSIGISRAMDRESLEDAIDTACAYDRRILVEQGVAEPREVNCAVLGYGASAQTSQTEMPVTGKDLLDFTDKYLRGGKGGAKGMESLARRIPAPISDELTARVKELSLEVFRAMDLKGVVRIDFILDKDDNVYINEANVIPGSLAFYLWEPAGLPFDKLLDRMIEDAFRAHSDKNGSIFSYDSSILSNIASGAAKR
ncbi:MAG: D-alanine--D-alanine ligase family protein [Christensenellales bacterium]|jgi:D-alanine-D-alanine ligase